MRKQIKIEDFHIGFDYEEYEVNQESVFKTHHWVRKSFGYCSESLQDIAKKIRSGHVRHVLTDIDKRGHKPVYIRTECGRQGGKIHVTRYLKIDEERITAIDISRNKIGNVKTISVVGYKIYPSTEKEYEAAHKQVTEFLT